MTYTTYARALDGTRYLMDRNGHVLAEDELDDLPGADDDREARDARAVRRMQQRNGVIVSPDGAGAYLPEEEPDAE